MTQLRLRPNVGEEEPGGSRVAAALAVAQLWRLLFPRDAEWPDAEPPAWPDAFGDSEGAAFAWLPDVGLCAWWNDAASAAEAAEHGLALCGPDPEVVARVHDKAFAARTCVAERIGPRELRECVCVFEPNDLEDADGFLASLRRELNDWPEGFARAATLKPRLGTSGRGRVRADDPSHTDLPGALPRLAARGGAVLEPWLERTADYSTQFHIARDGTLTLLGTLSLVVSPSGVYRGHRGELDHRGRVVCGAGLDDRLIDAAAEVARAAYAEGYFGPCGVDAFVFRRDGEEVLRPVVEFNARFTTGTVLLGLLHRVRTWLEAMFPGEPGGRRAIAFGLDGAHDAPLDADAALEIGTRGARLSIFRGALLDAGN